MISPVLAAVLNEACQQRSRTDSTTLIEKMWLDAISTWAHSQPGRRAAMACADAERRAVHILCDEALR